MRAEAVEHKGAAARAQSGTHKKRETAQRCSMQSPYPLCWYGRGAAARAQSCTRTGARSKVGILVKIDRRITQRRRQPVQRCARAAAPLLRYRRGQV